ncbi:MAG: hypothetical protein CL867_08015 [Cytophagaceae bacterium]|nr:hypothetical protein [Cytophagaceae bacterium]
MRTVVISLLLVLTVLPFKDKDLWSSQDNEGYRFDTAVIFDQFIDGEEVEVPTKSKVIYWINSKEEGYYAQWTLKEDGQLLLHFRDHRHEIKGTARYTSIDILQQAKVVLPYHIRPVAASKSYILVKHLDKKVTTHPNLSRYSYTLNNKRIQKSRQITGFKHEVAHHRYQEYNSPSFDFLKTRVYGKQPYAGWIVATHKYGLDGNLYYSATLDSIIDIERQLQLE